MLGKSKTKLIIVCDKKTEKYANYLRQLVSKNDDGEKGIVGVPDGSVDVAVWLDSDYLANKAQISSSEHIMFVGNNKVSKNEMSSMVIQFDKCGMKYGWLGKRAMMNVDDTEITQEAYDEFIELCKGYEVEFERLVLDDKTKSVFDEKKSEDSCLDDQEDTSKIESNTFFDVIEKSSRVLGKKTMSAALEVSSGVKKLQFRSKFRDQQYRALAVIMYLDGLAKFLEE